MRGVSTRTVRPPPPAPPAGQPRLGRPSAHNKGGGAAETGVRVPPPRLGPPGRRGASPQPARGSHWKSPCPHLGRAPARGTPRAHVVAGARDGPSRAFLPGAAERTRGCWPARPLVDAQCAPDGGPPGRGCPAAHRVRGTGREATETSGRPCPHTNLAQVGGKGETPGWTCSLEAAPKLFPRWPGHRRVIGHGDPRCAGHARGLEQGLPAAPYSARETDSKVKEKCQGERRTASRARVPPPEIPLSLLPARCPAPPTPPLRVPGAAGGGGEAGRNRTNPPAHRVSFSLVPSTSKLSCREG